MDSISLTSANTPQPLYLHALLILSLFSYAHHMLDIAIVVVSSLLGGSINFDYLSTNLLTHYLTCHLVHLHAHALWTCWILWVYKPIFFLW